MVLCDRVDFLLSRGNFTERPIEGHVDSYVHHRFMSSHLPSLTERAAVQKLIAQKEKRLRRLDSRKGYVRSSKQAAERERERAQIDQSVIAQHKSFLAPIRALPPEVLALIFDHYGDQKEVAATLSCVCRTWYQTACTFARYWTRISLRFPPDPRRSQIPYILSRIERSRQLPLFFVIDGRLQEGRPNLTSSVRREIKRCMEALIGENGRNLLRCSQLLLDLDANFSNPEGLAWFNHPMPSLSWASIIFKSRHQWDALDFLGNAPNLTTLTVDIAGLLDMPKTDFPRLNTLLLHYHSSISMFPYLITCHSITLLHISDYTCASIPAPSSHTVVPAFAMTSLQWLILEGLLINGFLKRVSFPNLRTLTLAAYRWNHRETGNEDQAMIAHVIECVLPSLTGVECLWLFRRPLHEDNVKDLLTAMTSLRFLCIYGKMPAVDHVLEDPDVCPNLFLTYCRTKKTGSPREPFPNLLIPKEAVAEVSRCFCQKRGKGLIV